MIDARFRRRPGAALQMPPVKRDARPRRLRWRSTPRQLMAWIHVEVHPSWLRSRPGLRDPAHACSRPRAERTERHLPFQEILRGAHSAQYLWGAIATGESLGRSRTGLAPWATRQRDYHEAFWYPCFRPPQHPRCRLPWDAVENWYSCSDTRFPQAEKRPPSTRAGMPAFSSQLASRHIQGTTDFATARPGSRAGC